MRRTSGTCRVAGGLGSDLAAFLSFPVAPGIRRSPFLRSALPAVDPTWSRKPGLCSGHERSARPIGKKDKALRSPEKAFERC
eukprot:scaffold2161_cov244-Pinguiococcus_pyrenoidosus.AAC.9